MNAVRETVPVEKFALSILDTSRWSKTMLPQGQKEGNAIFGKQKKKRKGRKKGTARLIAQEQLWCVKPA